MRRFAILLVSLVQLTATWPSTSAQEPPLFAEAAPVRGVVVDEGGAPLAGVRCWASGFETSDGGTWVVTFFSGATRFHVTGADGSFEIAGRHGVRFDVDLDADGFAPTRVESLEPGAAPRIVMRKGSTVSGRVVQIVDGEKVPVEGARVSIRRPNPRGVWFESERWSDRDGRFGFTRFLPEDDGGPAWQLCHAGATLELAGQPGDQLLEAEVEVRMSLRRSGRR